VLLKRVVAREIGAARIAGEYDLEQPRVPHAVLNQLIDVAHAERPVRHAHGQAVNGHLHHEARRHLLEVHGVVVEPAVAGELLEPARVFGKLIGHAQTSAAACSVKKARIASNTDSGVDSAKLPALPVSSLSWSSSADVSVPSVCCADAAVST